MSPHRSADPIRNREDQPNERDGLHHSRCESEGCLFVYKHRIPEGEKGTCQSKRENDEVKDVRTVIVILMFRHKDSDLFARHVLRREVLRPKPNP